MQPVPTPAQPDVDMQTRIEGLFRNSPLVDGELPDEINPAIEEDIRVLYDENPELVTYAFNAWVKQLWGVALKPAAAQDLVEDLLALVESVVTKEERLASEVTDTFRDVPDQPYHTEHVYVAGGQHIATLQLHDEDYVWNFFFNPKETVAYWEERIGKQS